MKRILTLLCLLFTLAGRAQTDSTEINLQRYKDMFTKGLITSTEYETLRRQTLGIQNTQVVVKDTTTKADSVLFRKGEADARDYYRTGAFFGSTLASTVVGTPVLGLIPAIAFTLIPPKPENAPSHDPHFWSNPAYKSGYMKEARKEKRGSAWKAWGVGVAIDCLIGGIAEIVISTKK